MRVEKIGIAYKVVEDDGEENLYIEVSDTQYMEFVWKYRINKIPEYRVVE